LLLHRVLFLGDGWWDKINFTAARTGQLGQSTLVIPFQSAYTETVGRSGVETDLVDKLGPNPAACIIPENFMIDTHSTR